MGDPQPAPLLTLLKPSTVAAYTAAGFWGDQTIYHLAGRQARATPQAFAVRDRDRLAAIAAFTLVGTNLSTTFSTIAGQL